MKVSKDQFAALDRSIAETVKRTHLETRIHARARALMSENGLAHEYCEEMAHEQATLEVTGKLEK